MARYSGEFIQWIEKDDAMFGHVLSSSFNFAFNHLGVLFRVTIIPVILSVALELAAFSFNSESMVWVDYALWSVLNTIIAVNVHRLVLMGPNSVPTFGRFTIGKIEIWFWLHYISLGIPVLLGSFLFAWIGPLLSLLVIVAMVVGCRVSLVFPAIAMGKGVSFPYAWKQTAQKTLFMILVVAVAPIVFAIIFVPVMALVVFIAPDSSPVYSMVSTNIVIAYVTILAVIALSFAYQDLTGDDHSNFSPEASREE
ncbi:hypothetical protein K6Q96_06530 [Grimontia kaedaensis]|uniref:Glycerophosphoryl diester phosphodiesterase membrane domain-containing protein n=1 Tax=Grimontia kaedaensis TaxID=2872157 RepID=A0ABY4WXC8_9GAMM|nr:hypothetical protein [Grimontia kaedaensis]USH03646.1 hypothetical protein K6Q96_06530 [Grimontia kaedaensis]